MSVSLFEAPVSQQESYDATSFAAQALSHWQNLAAVLDHSLLRPDATEAQVIRLCEESLHYGFAAVVTHSCWTAIAHSVLAGTPVRVASTIGFPLGATLSTTKRQEAEEAIRLGARELDVVMNIGALKSGHRTYVQHDLHGVVQVANEVGARVKVILETALLSIDEKILASEIAIAAGAHFLKTSTGFSTGGAAVQDVQLLRGVAGTRCEVKASGGIRTLADARRMLEAGASRIGASASISIVRELGAPEFSAAEFAAR